MLVDNNIDFIIKFSIVQAAVPNARVYRFFAKLQS